MSDVRRAIAFREGICDGTHMQAYQAIQRLREGIREFADVVFADKRFPRSTMHATAAIADDEYARGRWDYLQNREEMSRYAVIAGYCMHGGSVSSVLDLGCGSGLLHHWLGRRGKLDYVGVDISKVAIDDARQQCADGSADFIAMDLATYTPDRKFDVIIFNEVLYYFDQPGEILKHFSKFLNGYGYFVVSLWDGADGRLAWRRSRDSLVVVDAVRTSHSSGLSWQIRLCRPRSP
jgi:2-polyprenyl-3-methyl-5-hydroxy-6-metoxy-1,4-benzoquinol methylase